MHSNTWLHILKRTNPTDRLTNLVLENRTYDVPENSTISWFWGWSWKGRSGSCLSIGITAAGNCFPFSGQKDDQAQTSAQHITNPTEHWPALMPRNLWVDPSELHNILQWTEYETLKLWKASSSLRENRIYRNKIVNSVCAKCLQSQHVCQDDDEFFPYELFKPTSRKKSRTATLKE